MTTAQHRDQIVGTAKHNRWQIGYAYWCAVGRTLIEIGKINPRQSGGQIYPCYQGNTSGEIHYSLVGQSAITAMDGKCGWDMIVGAAEWAAKYPERV